LRRGRRHDVKYRSTVMFLMVAFITSLAWSGESLEQTKIARVGIVSFRQHLTAGQMKKWWEEGFQRTLQKQGWIEGKNVLFEYRNATGDPSQLAEAVAELVRLKVDVIVAVSAPAVRAAYAATRTIPIVATDFTTDPVAEGYVESYGRPARNLTGVFLGTPAFAGKWLELLRAIVPGLSRVGVLWDASVGTTHLRALESIAQSVGVQLQILEVRKPDDIDRAFTAFTRRPQALIILPSPMIYEQSERLAKLAMKHRLPATSMARAFAEAGGALSYGPDAGFAAERAAVLLAKILGGAKPAELPVEQPTNVQLVVNVRTTKLLKLTVPDSVLIRADEVIR
jgi:putative ABC transport system substrate-binding protein